MTRIFVVDDEVSILAGMRRTLEAAGYEVLAFERGRDAVARLASDPPDLLITDIFMPEIEGMEIIRKARILRPNMPVVAMTGFSSAQFDSLQMAGKLGAAATLRKPFLPSELRAVVSQLLLQQSDEA